MLFVFEAVKETSWCRCHIHRCTLTHTGLTHFTRTWIYLNDKLTIFSFFCERMPKAVLTLGLAGCSVHQQVTSPKKHNVPSRPELPLHACTPLCHVACVSWPVFSLVLLPDLSIHLCVYSRSSCRCSLFLALSIHCNLYLRFPSFCLSCLSSLLVSCYFSLCHKSNILLVSVTHKNYVRNIFYFFCKIDVYVKDSCPCPCIATDVLYMRCFFRKSQVRNSQLSHCTQMLI